MTACALISIDPAMRKTGAGVYHFETEEIDPSTRGLRVKGANTFRVKVQRSESLMLLTSDTYREVDQYKTIRASIVEALAGRPWFAVVEHPTKRDSWGTPPTAAFWDWCKWLTNLAREAADRLGKAFRKPTIITPDANQWRKPLGLATRAPRGFSKKEGRIWLKGQSIRLAERNTGRKVESADEADAACLGTFGLRCADLGCAYVGKKVEPIRYVA